MNDCRKNQHPEDNYIGTDNDLDAREDDDYPELDDDYEDDLNWEDEDDSWNDEDEEE